MRSANRIKPASWLSESRSSKRTSERQSVFAALLSATLSLDFQVPQGYLHLNKQGVANYWLPGSTDSMTEPYPDDLDDTAVIVGLRARAGLLTDQEKMQFVQVLVRGEHQPGGPYCTWCTVDPAWRDLDPVVNANIAWALRECGVTLPALTTYLHKAWHIEATSPYCPNYWVTQFLILRSLPNLKDEQDLLSERLKSHPPHDMLSTAAVLLACQLTELPSPVTWKTSLRNTAWDWQPLITERAGANPTYAGSKLATYFWCTAATSSAGRALSSRTSRGRPG